MSCGVPIVLGWRLQCLLGRLLSIFLHARSPICSLVYITVKVLYTLAFQEQYIINGLAIVLVWRLQCLLGAVCYLYFFHACSAICSLVYIRMNVYTGIPGRRYVIWSSNRTRFVTPVLARPFAVYICPCTLANLFSCVYKDERTHWNSREKICQME